MSHMPSHSLSLFPHADNMVCQAGKSMLHMLPEFEFSITNSDAQGDGRNSLDTSMMHPGTCS